jgi:LysM repeat protein
MVKLNTSKRHKTQTGGEVIKSGIVRQVRMFSQTKDTIFISFAAELTLSLSVLFVVLLQFMQFGVLSFSRNYSDNSIATSFLASHPEVNPELFDKSHTSKTLVSRTSFVPQAFAENTLPAESPEGEVASDDLTDFNNFVINENSIVAPNPDSVSKLIERQIKIYETKPEDTLSGIAAANGLKTQTLIWANNLKNSNIQPGWKLLIPPTDGVVYKADSNDTLPDLARKFSVKLEKIISYNGLENAEDIEPDQVLIIPDGKIAPPPQPKKVADQG